MSNAATKGRPPWNLLLVVGSVVATLFISECVLALLEPKPMRLDHRGFYTYDPLLGWKMKPNARRVNVTEEFRATEVTNSKGIRGGEYSYEKRPNEYRLLILGDSFAEGYTVDFENLFSEVLKFSLNSRSKGTYYEVINAGTVGYSTDQELLFYQTMGREYAPDLVVLMFYENDPADNTSRNEIYGKFKPLFGIENERLVLSRSPPPGTVPPEVKIEAPPFDMHQWLTKHSRVLRTVETGLTEMGLMVHRAPRKENVPYPLRFLSKEPTPEISHAWKITEMILMELKNSVEASGASLVAYYVPSSYTLDRDLWKATKQQFEMSGNRWNPHQVESEFRRICDKHSIPCMGGAREFEQGAKTLGTKAASFYHLRDGHWNSPGHRFVGEMMANSLRSWSLAESDLLGARRPHRTAR